MLVLKPSNLHGNDLRFREHIEIQHYREGVKEEPSDERVRDGIGVNAAEVDDLADEDDAGDVEQDDAERACYADRNLLVALIDFE